MTMGEGGPSARSTIPYRSLNSHAARFFCRNAVRSPDRRARAVDYFLAGFGTPEHEIGTGVDGLSRPPYNRVAIRQPAQVAESADALA